MPVMGIWFVGVGVSHSFMRVLVNVTYRCRIVACVLMLVMRIIMLVAVCMGLYCVTVLMFMLLSCQKHGSQDHKR